MLNGHAHKNRTKIESHSKKVKYPNGLVDYFSRENH